MLTSATAAETRNAIEVARRDGFALSAADRSCDQEAHQQEADGGHQREEDEPALHEQPRGGGGFADRGDHELRRRPGVRPDGERVRAADGVTVGGDDAPEDEVPALVEMVERLHELVRVGGAPIRPAGRVLVAGRIGDGDDREARFDRFAVGERDLRGRGVDDAASRPAMSAGAQRAPRPRPEPRASRRPQPGSRVASAHAGSCQRPPPSGDERHDREDERETAEDERHDRERRVTAAASEGGERFDGRCGVVRAFPGRSSRQPSRRSRSAARRRCTSWTRRCWH